MKYMQQFEPLINIVTTVKLKKKILIPFDKIELKGKPDWYNITEQLLIFQRVPTKSISFKNFYHTVSPRF